MQFSELLLLRIVRFNDMCLCQRNSKFPLALFDADAEG